MTLLRKTLNLLLLALIALPATAQIRLPKLVGDGMVLQRDTKIRIWGWAAPGEQVATEFLGKTYNATATPDGKWEITLPAQKAGGPHEMTLKASNTITLRDILIGDVWVCSGQSNMEMAMMGIRDKYAGDIASSENKFIRQFLVPRKHIFSRPMHDLSGGSWVSADPTTVLQFTAVGYFFARDLYDKYKVPIGLINATLGGSRTESWMSFESLKPYPTLYEEAQKFQDTTNIIKTNEEDRTRIAEWNQRSRATDAAYADPAGPWSKADFDDSQWEEIEIPSLWANSPLGQMNGVVWFRRSFDVPASLAGKAAKLPFGNIVESDSVFINGKFIGGRPSQYIPRNYNIPEGLLKAGKNTIAVRVVCPSGNGGFVPQKEYAITGETKKIDLSGKWKYKVGAKMETLVGPSFIQWRSTGLYNGMISPLLPYAIKGVLWYQGESNIGREKQQVTLFQDLIKSWRAKWNVGDFPFLFVQLPNFNEAHQEPSDGGWARFREAQNAALSLPNTGMAVTIDVGEWNDIHPANKKDVGLRLALAAQKVAYKDKNVVYSGPIYDGMQVKGNKVIVSFKHVGSGLTARGGNNVKQFAIAGADKKFVWAEARIENGNVVVWSDSVEKPVAVRYAWADNPEGANLFNKEGLPASPFRTDND